MPMYRPTKILVVTCLAVVFLTAAIPALWGDLSVVMEPLDPIFGVVLVSVSVEPPDRHPSPFPFLAPADSRGPPNV
jgi:hypothetical protein